VDLFVSQSQFTRQRPPLIQYSDGRRRYEYVPNNKSLPLFIDGDEEETNKQASGTQHAHLAPSVTVNYRSPRAVLDEFGQEQATRPSCEGNATKKRKVGRRFSVAVRNRRRRTLTFAGVVLVKYVTLFLGVTLTSVHFNEQNGASERENDAAKQQLLRGTKSCAAPSLATVASS